MGFFPLRVKIVYCGVSQPSLRQGAIGNSFARNNICKDGFLMQTRICFPIAAGKVETLFFISDVAEISFTSSYKDL